VGRGFEISGTYWTVTGVFSDRNLVDSTASDFLGLLSLDKEETQNRYFSVSVTTPFSSAATLLSTSFKRASPFSSFNRLKDYRLRDAQAKRLSTNHARSTSILTSASRKEFPDDDFEIPQRVAPLPAVGPTEVERRN
jgi:hypothetical protein